MKRIMTKKEIANLHRICDKLTVKDIDYTVGGWYGATRIPENIIMHIVAINRKDSKPYLVEYYQYDSIDGKVKLKKRDSVADMTDMWGLFDTRFPSREQAFKWITQRYLQWKTLFKDDIGNNANNIYYAVGGWYGYNGSPTPDIIKIISIVSSSSYPYKAERYRYMDIDGKYVLHRDNESLKLSDLKNDYTIKFASGDQAFKWFKRRNGIKDSKMKDIDYAVGQWYGSRLGGRYSPSIAKILSVNNQHERPVYHLEVLLYVRKNFFGGEDAVKKEYDNLTAEDMKAYYPTRFPTGAEAMKWLKQRIAATDSLKDSVGSDFVKALRSAYPQTRIDKQLADIDESPNTGKSRTYVFFLSNVPSPNDEAYGDFKKRISDIVSKLGVKGGKVESINGGRGMAVSFYEPLASGKDAAEVKRGDWFADKASGRIIYVHDVKTGKDGKTRVAFMTQKAGSSNVSSMKSGNLPVEEFLKLGYRKAGSRMEASRMAKGKDSRAVITKDDIGKLHKLCNKLTVKDIDYVVGRYYGSYDGAKEPYIVKITSVNSHSRWPYELELYRYEYAGGQYRLQKTARITPKDLAEMKREFPTAFPSGDQAFKWLKQKYQNANWKQ